MPFSNTYFHYYKITCTACDSIIALRSLHPHPRYKTRADTPLRPLRTPPHCPLCQQDDLQEKEILLAEYQVIEKNWDLMRSDEEAESLCSTETLKVSDEEEESIAVIDISML